MMLGQQTNKNVADQINTAKQADLRLCVYKSLFSFEAHLGCKMNG